MPKGILEGLRVLELAQMVAGPYCARLLAGLGAEVIKVEPPGSGDRSRRWGPFPQDVPSSETSGLYLHLNAGKRSITLDLTTARGRELAYKLVASADIVVEDLVPRDAERLGLDYATLHRINPGAIVTCVTPFGQTGPYRNYRAYNLTSYHASGEGYLLPTGDDYTRAPVKGAGFLSDYETGLGAAIATMGALFSRGLNGQGQMVDISNQEWGIGLNREFLTRYPNEGVSENRWTQGPPGQGMMLCKDGYILVASAEEHQWLGWIKFMGMSHLAEDERFKDRTVRAQHQAEFRDIQTKWLADKPKDMVYHGAQKLGTPVGIAFTPEDLFQSEHLRARSFFVDIEHPKAGKVTHPGAPYKFSKSPIVQDKPAPLLGQDNEAVYCTLLGLSHEDLSELRHGGVI